MNTNSECDNNRTMILHRFCSASECVAYLNGQTLVNRTDHYAGGRGGSLSRGFCFFSGDIKEWARRLNGLVDFDVLLTVEADPARVRESRGIYVNWAKDTGSGMPPRKLFTEYCTERYDRRGFHFISADPSFATTHVSRSQLQGWR